jgi:hypothetical protein
MKRTSEIERQKKLVEFAEQLQAAYTKLLNIYNPNSSEHTDIGAEFLRSPDVAFNTFENSLYEIEEHFKPGNKKVPDNYSNDIVEVKKTLTKIKNSATEIKNLVPKNAQQPLDKIFSFIQKIFTMFTQMMGNASKLTNETKQSPGTGTKTKSKSKSKKESSHKP